MGTKIVQGGQSKQLVRELVLQDMLNGREILIHERAGFTEFKPIAEIIGDITVEMLTRKNTTLVVKSSNVDIDRLKQVLPPANSQGTTLIIQMVRCGNAEEFNNLSAEHYSAEGSQLSMTTPYAYKKSEDILSEIMGLIKERDARDEDS